MTDQQSESGGLTPRERARATAALDAFYANPGGSDYRVPGFAYSPEAVARMHAALEAPDLDAAVLALGVEPDPVLSTPEQDRENRALLGDVRDRLRGFE